MILKEILCFQRKQGDYKAGFCFLNENLNQLQNRKYVLHEQELLYYEKLNFDRRKQSYLLGRIASKEAVQTLFENKLEYQKFLIDFGIFQFPVLKNIGENLQVCITHCENYGASVVFPEEHPVGLDMERINSDKVETINSILTETEKTLVKSQFSSLTQGCTIFWSAKEALSKIIRTGFTTEPSIFEIKSVIKQDNFFLCSFSNFYQYKAVSFVIKGLVITLVIPKNSLFDFKSITHGIHLTMQR